MAPANIAPKKDTLDLEKVGEPQPQVPKLEPQRGTAALLEDLVDSCSTPAELIERLGA
jgi:hypothetical protein